MQPHSSAKHLNEPGWNGIELRKAFNCWVRNVDVQNSDTGVTICEA